MMPVSTLFNEPDIFNSVRLLERHYRMSDQFLDHPILTSRYFYPRPNRFEEPFFVEGNGFRLGCRNQGQPHQENESK
jgi:hypothetical protein